MQYLSLLCLSPSLRLSYETLSFLIYIYIYDYIYIYSQVALVVKNLPAKVDDLLCVGSVLGWGTSPEEGCGNPLQYSCLENPLDRIAWQAIVYRAAKSVTGLK